MTNFTETGPSTVETQHHMPYAVKFFAAMRDAKGKEFGENTDPANLDLSKTIRRLGKLSRDPNYIQQRITEVSDHPQGSSEDALEEAQGMLTEVERVVDILSEKVPRAREKQERLSAVEVALYEIDKYMLVPISEATADTSDGALKSIGSQASDIANKISHIMSSQETA